MFSKRPFKGSRRPVSNPTWETNPPTSDVQDKAKQLPALPNDSPHIMHNSLDVSPVGSPIPRRDSQSSFCVSPIGEGDIPRYPSESTFSIPESSPLPREEPRPAQELRPVQEPRRFISGKPTRWDDFSGEPTTSDFGQASQVNPQNTLHKATVSHSSNPFKQFNPKKKLTAARNRISSISKIEDIPKERSRSSSRGFPEHSTRHGVSDTSPKLDNFTFVPTTVTTISSGGPATTLPTKLAAERAPSHPREETPEFQFDDEVASLMLPADEPRSRFSATTYTSTEPNSQNPSPRESMHFDNQSTDDLSGGSMMGRRRPIAPVGPPTSKKPVINKPVRKPTPSQVAEQVKQMPVQSAPEPKDAQGRIEAMETKRDELAQRRFNLETVIRELMKVFQPNSVVVYDSAAKAEVQKSVKSMENEIADIRKEEHDLGMKITRAWRRLDEKENAGDGNNLWVKRVTS